MNEDEIVGLSMWLIENRSKCHEGEFIDRLSQLISASCNGMTPRRLTKSPEVHAAFLADYKSGRGGGKRAKRGFFDSLVKKHGVKRTTARKWVSDAGLAGSNVLEGVL